MWTWLRFKPGVFWALGLVLVLGACTTKPDPRPTAYWLGYLGQGPGLYGRLAVDPKNPVLGPLRKNPGMADVVDRVTEVYFSVHVTPGEKSEALALALGDFPKTFAGWALDGNKDWTRLPGNEPVWQSKTSPATVTLPENGTALMSNRRIPPGPLNSGTNPLAGALLKDLEKADLGLVILEPGPALMGTKWGKNLPINLIQGFFKAGTWDFQGTLRLRTPSDKAGSKGLASLVKIALSGWLVALDEGLAAQSAEWTLTWSDTELIVNPVVLPYHLVTPLLAQLFPEKEEKKP